MVSGNLAHKIINEVQEVDYTYLPEPLLHTSISLAEILKNNTRFDASSYSSDVEVSINKILHNKFGYLTITGDDGLCKAYRPGIVKRNFVSKKEGIGMYTPSQIVEVYPKAYKYLSKEQVIELSDWIMKEGELALTCSGTVGNVSMVSKTLKGKVFSQNMIRLYNYAFLGYVYAFFQTSTGKLVLTSNKYGAVIKHIDPEHLDNIFIPNAPDRLKQQVHELIKESFDLRDTSNELLDKAEAILYKQLQLKPLEELDVVYFDNSIDEFRNFTTKLSNLDYRLDGSYHVPIVQKVENEIRKHSKEVVKLDKLSQKIILAGVFKRTYVDSENGVPFLGGRDISQLNPQVEKFLSKAVHSSRIKKELEVFENYILISDRGTIGKVQIVPKHWNGWAVSQNIIKVIPLTKEISGYLYCFLNSDYGQVLIKRQTYGSVVDMVDDKNVMNINIPLLKNEKAQSEINNFVLEANELRYIAYQKEQEAIKIMQDII